VGCVGHVKRVCHRSKRTQILFSSFFVSPSVMG
jgi:hypothetical protein